MLAGRNQGEVIPKVIRAFFRRLGQDGTDLLRLSRPAQVLLVLGVGIHVAGFMAFRVWPSDPPPIIFPKPAVVFNSPKQKTPGIMRDQALLADTEPLFLPTALNYGARAPLVRLAEPEPSPFSAYALEVKLSQADFLGDARREASLPSVERALLGGQDAAVFAALGQDREDRTALPGRGGAVRVVDVSTGKVVLERTLPDVAPFAGQPLWVPAEFLVTVMEDGIATRPLQTLGSGQDEVDDALRRWILGSDIGRALRPGTYRLEAGP